MKVPHFALNDTYLSSPNAYQPTTTSYQDDTTTNYHDDEDEDNSHSYLLSPTRPDDCNMMVDMAVAKDKTPFLCASKANDNLQRALDRFLVYHEREKKLTYRKFEQEERIYRNKVARCSTALPRNKIKTFKAIVEEPADEEVDTEGKWAITKKQTLSSPFGNARPKTAGEPSSRNEEDTEDTVELTYTFNSLFGDVKKHVTDPSLTDDEEEELEQENGDPLAVQRLYLHPGRAEGLASEETDCLTPITATTSTLSPRSAYSSRKHSRRWSASSDAFSEWERKRTVSGSDSVTSLLASRDWDGTSGVVKEGPAPEQYVCENVFGNLSLQVQKDSRLDKIQIGGPGGCHQASRDIETVGRGRRSSISENAYRQLGRVKRYEQQKESSRTSSISSDLYCGSSNTTLTYSNATGEPGMAVSKAINFLDKLDNYNSSKTKRSKLHIDMVEVAASKNTALLKKKG